MNNLYRYIFIAKNNMKKQKGDMITFFILIMVSALLLFISISFLLGTSKVLASSKEKANGSDALIYLAENTISEELLEDIIIENEWLGDYEKTKGMTGSFEYRKAGSGKAWSKYSFVICTYDEDRTIQRITTDIRDLSDNDIVLPISLSINYQVGDKIELKLEENEYKFRVAGFDENAYYCSPMNMGQYLIYVSDDMFDELNDENPDNFLTPITMFNCKYSSKAIKSDIDGNTMLNQLSEEHKMALFRYAEDHPDSKLNGLWNWLPVDLMMSASMILPFVFVGFLVMFAVIIFVIALVITSFSIKNFIMTNMRNTAIMEASGYTVKELTAILVIQLTFVAFAGGAMGCIAGAACIDKVGIMILMMLGLPWNQPISIGTAIGVTIGTSIITALITRLLGRDYKKTPVLDALRGGINAHNFRKNFFAFDKTAFPVSITLALKETFGKFKSQIGIIFIAGILTISTMVGFGMLDTYVLDPKGLLNIAGITEENADIYDANDAVRQSVESMAMVESVNGTMWRSYEYYNGRKKQSFTTRAYYSTDIIKGGSIVEGRWPKYDNEVMFGTTAASTLGVKTGDSVTLKNGNVEENYIVSGLCQTMNNMGQMAYMTFDGLRRTGDTINSYTLNVMFKEGHEYQEFEREFKDMYPDMEVEDFKVAYENSVGVIRIGMEGFTILIAVITVAIVAFVEALIIRTQVTREWRNLGVSKALGFTSGQLIVQTMLSNIPSILMGVFAGLLLAIKSTAKVMMAAMSIFGFRNVDINLRPQSYLFTAIIIIGVAMGTSAFIGRRIKVLEPVKMITEE